MITSIARSAVLALIAVTASACAGTVSYGTPVYTSYGHGPRYYYTPAGYVVRPAPYVITTSARPVYVTSPRATVGVAPAVLPRANVMAQPPVAQPVGGWRR